MCIDRADYAESTSSESLLLGTCVKAACRRVYEQVT